MKCFLGVVAVSVFCLPLARASIRYGAQDTGLTVDRPRVVSGAVRLTPDEFTVSSSGNVYEVLRPNARGKVLSCDIGQYWQKSFCVWREEEKFPPHPWLYVDGKAYELAAYPNRDEGWLTFDTAVGEDGFLLKGDGERARTWDFSGNARLKGYWTHDWAESYLKAAGFESSPSGLVLRVRGRHQYGIAKGTWGRKTRRFRAVNLPEELDAPGEFYVCPRTRKLYVYPREGFLSGRIELAVETSPLLVLDGARDMRFEGMVFCSSHSSPAAVVGTGTNVVFSHCVFRGLGFAGVILKGEGIVFENCLFEELGGRCIELDGGDFDRLEPSGNRIESNEFRRWAGFHRVYEPAIRLAGVGAVVRGCRFYDAPHSAIIYSGNDHVLESNEVHHVLQETGDAGAFYTGRRTDTLGNVIRGNYFHDLGSSGRFSPSHIMAVYFDDCDWGDDVISNRFERLECGVFIGGGNLHDIIGNRFSDCKVGVRIDSRGRHWPNFKKISDQGLNWFEKWAYEHDWRRPPWSVRYPRYAEMLADRPDIPHANKIVGNAFMDCKTVFDFKPSVIAMTNEMPVSCNKIIRTEKRGSAGNMIKCSTAEGQ